MVHVLADADVDLDVLLPWLALLLLLILGSSGGDWKMVVQFRRPPDGEIRRRASRGNDGVLGVEEALDGCDQLLRRGRDRVGIRLGGEDEAPLEGDEDVDVAVVLLLGPFDGRRHADEELPQRGVAGGLYVLVHGGRHTGGVGGIGERGEGRAAHGESDGYLSDNDSGNQADQ